MPKPKPHFEHERSHWRNNTSAVIGMDEVGRGAFAGPVVVGAVVFSKDFDETSKYQNLNNVRDSKSITKNMRNKLSSGIRSHCTAWSVGAVPSDIIDRIGINQALQLAARMAIDDLVRAPANVDNYQILTDTKLISNVERYNNIHEVEKGDAHCFSIAAASIVAKVWRDTYMEQLSQCKNLKIYDWKSNSGYGTKHHRLAIQKYGPSFYHRKSFLRNTLGK